MSQINNYFYINRMELISSFTGLFFVFSFWNVTYSLNIYILFLFIIYLILFINKNKTSFFVSSLFILFSFIYFYSHGLNEAYRWLKTFLLVFPLIYLCNNYNLKPSKILDLFIKSCAGIVYLEFLFFVINGHTFIPYTTSTFSYGFEFPRYKALFEDSNFFSYATLVYILFKKISYGRYDKFLVGSLLLSLSISAISAFLFFYTFYGLYKKLKNYTFMLRFLAIIFVFFFSFIYYYLVLNSDNISKNTENEFVKFKLVSLSLRFEAQKTAIEDIVLGDKMLLGFGAGKARESNARNMNFHNTFLQIFYEMGGITLILVLLFCLYILLNINILFLPIFVLVIFMSTIMEVFYFPLLIFVYYLSKVRIKKV